MLAFLLVAPFLLWVGASVCLLTGAAKRMEQRHILRKARPANKYLS
jgi:hypothetical protein